jgi:hypothetical protein
LKSNHEERKYRFESQIKSLQLRLKERDESQEPGANKENKQAITNGAQKQG